MSQKPIRLFIATQRLEGMDEDVATFQAAETDYDGRPFCGKTRAAAGETFAHAGVTYESIIHVPASKIDMIIAQGCSMLKHLPDAQLEAQRREYVKGRDALLAPAA